MVFVLAAELVVDPDIEANIDIDLAVLVVASDFVVVAFVCQFAVVGLAAEEASAVERQPHKDWKNLSNCVFPTSFL